MADEGKLQLEDLAVLCVIRKVKTESKQEICVDLKVCCLSDTSYSGFLGKIISQNKFKVLVSSLVALAL